MKIKSYIHLLFYGWIVVTSRISFAQAQAQAMPGAEPPRGPLTAGSWQDLFKVNNVIKSDQPFSKFISTYLELLLAFGSLVAFLFLGFNALIMITAAGDEEKFEKGKKGLVTAIIGLIIMITSFTIAIAARNIVK
ncbi:MAG: hypothetical protein Q7S64_02070 [bacterium]|nr:hypothetical protein [bacterium]